LVYARKWGDQGVSQFATSGIITDYFGGVGLGTTE